MNSFLFKVECLTNLHVGSGDANYSVVDNEVEKDAVLGCPIIHASGVKGALRDFYKDKKRKDFVVEGKENVERSAEEAAKAIFGDAAKKDKTASSSIRFMDACMLSRPLRVSGGNISFIQVTTLDIINHFIRQALAFGCLPAKLNGLREFTQDDIQNVQFGNADFLSTLPGIRVEDEDTSILAQSFPQLDLLKTLLGGHFALAKSLDDFMLPVIARNNLGEERNLWYEEYVPHHSVFYLTLQAEKAEELNWLPNKSVIQFGGNATVGCGYTRLTLWEDL